MKYGNKQAGRAARRGAAMIEAAVCLAVFTPVVFTAVRLGYGANQVHQLEAAVTEAARLAGTCHTEDQARRAAVDLVPGLDPATVEFDIDRTAEPPLVRVTIQRFPVIRLQGTQTLDQAPSAVFPYACNAAADENE
jgi:Flp pilus assembly protein TadG